MNHIRNLSLLALAIAGAAPAWATKCPDGLDYSQHPDGNCSWYYQGTDPSRPAAAGAAAGVKSAIDNRVVVDASGAPVSTEQRQQQQQDQQQAQRLNSTNTAGGGVGTGGAGGSVTIQGAQAGSGDTYRSSFTAWAPVVHGAGAAAVPTAAMGPIVIPCGPQQYLYDEDVMGVVIGPFGGITRVKLGTRTRSIPMSAVGGDAYRIEDIVETRTLPTGLRLPVVIGQRMYGHMVAGYAAVLTTSSARSLSLGIYQDGNGGQGGAAGSAGMQQQSKDLEAFECEVAVRYLRADPPPAKAVVVIAATKPRPPRAPKPKVVPKPCPVCCVPAATLVCPAPAPAVVGAK